MADGIAVRETDESVGKYLEWYIENIAKIKNQPTTIYGYKKMMEKHILPALGGIKLKNLSAQQIQEYITHKQRELSANTVIKHVDFLRICFDKAVDMGKLKINPASRVTCPHKVKYHVQPYTPLRMILDSYVKILIASICDLPLTEDCIKIIKPTDFLLND